MTKFFASAAIAVAMVAGAGSASATSIHLIDQAELDAAGTTTFGATITSTGLFSHEFDFTVDTLSDVSGSVVTIRTSNFSKDIDFTSIDLDGFAFTPIGGAGAEPSETWILEGYVVNAGTHTITVAGNVVTTGEGRDAASYSGTINVVPVPEPATWGLMIAGFGGAGAMLRSRRRTVAA